MMPILWILLIIAGLLELAPKWTRPDLFFAVTVQADFAFTAQAQRILQRYRLELALHALIAFALTSLAGVERGWTPVLGIGWLVLGAGWAVARAHRATAAHAAAPSPVREAELNLRPRRMPGGWLTALGPLAFLAAAAVYAWVFWDRLPPRIPVHWGLHGADRWVDRTLPNVFGFLALLASFAVFFMLVSYGMLHWSRTISVTGERARGESLFRRGVLWLLVGIQYVVVVPAVLRAFGTGGAAAWPWPVLMLALIAIALIVLIRMGQGGSHVVDAAEFQPPIGDHTPDAAWKWGLFYFNPDDSAIIVEKRFGLGYTVNLGNPWSWVLIAVLLLPVVVALALRHK